MQQYPNINQQPGPYHPVSQMPDNGTGPVWHTDYNSGIANNVGGDFRAEPGSRGYLKAIYLHIF